MANISLVARRRIVIPVALAAGAFAAAPALLKRAFAPPQPGVERSPSDFGLPENRVILESITGSRLHGWHIAVDGPAPAIIVLHGWGSSSSLMLPLAPHLHTAGFHTFFLDARNHGHSGHDNFSSMPRFAEDLEVAARWLRDLPDVTAVAVIGHSVGAGAAILTASRTELLDAVVSVSSFAHPGELMRRQMSRIPGPAVTAILRAVQRTIGYQFDEFAPRKRIANVGAPVMLVHGDADRVVPISSMRELADAKPNAQILVVPGGAHSDLAPYEAHIGEMIDFFRRHLPPIS